MNYSTYLKLKQVRLQTENTPPVVGADGSDLGAAGTAVSVFILLLL